MEQKRGRSARAGGGTTARGTSAGHGSMRWATILTIVTTCMVRLRATEAQTAQPSASPPQDAIFFIQVRVAGSAFFMLLPFSPTRCDRAQGNTHNACFDAISSTRQLSMNATRQGSACEARTSTHAHTATSSCTQHARRPGV
jgi:hypothetical protein